MGKRHHIYAKDLIELLTPNTFVVSAIIDAACTILLHQHPPNERLTFIDSGDFDEVCNWNLTKRKNVTYVPLHLPAHWISIWGNPDTNAVYYYDSLGINRPDLRRLALTFSLGRRATLKQIRGPIQQENDCAIHTINCFEALLTSTDTLNPSFKWGTSSVWALERRFEIAKEIILNDHLY